MFDKSLDGGETWGTDIFISDIPGGWAFNVLEYRDVMDANNYVRY